MGAALTCICGGTDFEPVFAYDAPPAGENRFPLPPGVPYRREVRRCRACGHFRSVHDLPVGDLYREAYVSSVYGEDGLRTAFNKIVALSPEQSDNAGRVTRILAFAVEQFPPSRPGDPPRTVLDVGSGLCVFLHRMKAAGWDGTALDPDPRAVRHAEEVAGVRGVCADFMEARDLGRFDLVTFNKVLEHVPDPVAMLARAAAFVKPEGFVYVELPDGEAAAAEGPGREEFFIEHHHAFSRQSARTTACRAGYPATAPERLREPSGKYTLRLFLPTPGEDRA